METGPPETGAENREPLPVVEPVQIGTVTQSGAGCALELDAGPIPSGAGRISVVNETNRRVSFVLVPLTLEQFFRAVRRGVHRGGRVRADPRAKPAGSLPAGSTGWTERLGDDHDNFTTGAHGRVSRLSP